MNKDTQCYKCNKPMKEHKAILGAPGGLECSEPQKENKEICKKEGHAWADEGDCTCCGEKRQKEESWENIAAITALKAYENKKTYGKFSEVIYRGIKQIRQSTIAQCIEILEKMIRDLGKKAQVAGSGMTDSRGDDYLLIGMRNALTAAIEKLNQLKVRE